MKSMCGVKLGKGKSFQSDVLFKTLQIEFKRCISTLPLWLHYCLFNLYKVYINLSFLSFVLAEAEVWKCDTTDTPFSLIRNNSETQ